MNALDIDLMRRLYEAIQWPEDWADADENGQVRVVAGDDALHGNPESRIRLNSGSAWMVGPRRKNKKEAQADLEFVLFVVKAAPAIIAALEHFERVKKEAENAGWHWDEWDVQDIRRALEDA